VTNYILPAAYHQAAYKLVSAGGTLRLEAGSTIGFCTGDGGDFSQVECLLDGGVARRGPQSRTARLWNAAPVICAIQERLPGWCQMRGSKQYSPDSACELPPIPICHLAALHL